MESTTAVCADCDAKNPQWASINRGVFICDECNSIHRQLGRHVSHTKHLYKSLWRPSQLFMVQYLALAGANRFWEHVLLEPLLSKINDSSKSPSMTDKKPLPDSPLHPTKADFIRKKYLFHGFFKLPIIIHPDDLNQQLHASVRTAVLDTSLYLLALGADPNYIHPVKGTSPVHVACQYEQISQLELLIAYGGDVCLRSSKGISPLEIALEKVQKSQQQQLDTATTGTDASSQPQSAPWSPLIECLVSAFYELTDGLSFYLCRRVPNHKAAIFLAASASANGTSMNGFKNGHSGSSGSNSGGPFKAFYGPGHFLVAPKSVKESNGSPDGDAEARAKVRSLDNVAFEDLCIDVYDEAERRLTNSFLESTVELPNSTGPTFIHGGGGGSTRPLPPSTSGGRPHSMSGALLSSIPPSAVSHPVNNTRPSSLILFFLPPNTSYTSVRNQARQKLGRLSMTAFRALVVDVLHEAARRLVPVLESTSALPLAVVRPKMRHEYITFGSGGVDQATQMTVNNDDEVLLVVGNTSGQDGQGISSRNRTTNATNTSFEDPVYDQVAVETEAGTVTRVSTTQSLGTTAISSNASISNSTSSTTAALAPIDFTNSTTEQQMQLECQTDEAEDPKPQQIVVSMREESRTSDVSHIGVDSRPGAVPGSRRLHLPATGRLAPYRASVPGSAYTNAHTGISKQANAPVSGVESTGVSSSSTCEGSLERCVGPTMLQQSVEGLRKEAVLSLVSEAVQTLIDTSEVEASRQIEQSDSRFAEVEAEVLRLKKERERAAQQVETLTSRLRELEAVCERLMEENNALKAAFSAGMVKTHEAATRLSPGTKQLTPPVDFKKGATSSVMTVTEGEGERATGFHADVTPEVSEDNSDLSEDEEDGEGYTNGNLHGQPKSQSAIPGSKRTNDSSSNYAVGTQCLDSGMLLRQGISLWGKSTSPADATTVEVTTTVSANSGQPINAPQPQPSTVKQVGPGAVRSYVNLQNTKPSSARTPIGKTQPTSSSPGGGLREVEVPDDYTAPNGTGSPSPAPPVIFSAQPDRNSSCAGVLRTSPATSTASAIAPQQLGAKRTSSGGGPESSTSQVDYSVPPHPSPSTGVLKKAPPVHPVSSGGGSTVWKHPPYERIVRGVECIIVRIRALLDAANSRRLHEQVRSSQLIQAAIQDLVVLFPPISKCHPTVGSALTSLMSNSQKLRLHCEANAEQSASSVSPRSSGNSSNQLITFAHEIASAAKTILNFFQAERH
nr:ARF GTPase activating protein GIT2 [Hymenolepis microstoma]